MTKLYLTIVIMIILAVICLLSSPDACLMLPSLDAQLSLSQHSTLNVQRILLATSPSAPLYTHFIYVFGHANLLHWLINAWACLVLHNVFRWYRLLVAYACAVGATFLPYVCTDAHPVLGLSSVTTFFFGVITPYLWRTNRMAVKMMLALLAIGIFLPHIAALLHIIAFATGYLYAHLEKAIRHITHYSH